MCQGFRVPDSIKRQSSKTVDRIPTNDMDIELAKQRHTSEMSKPPRG